MNSVRVVLVSCLVSQSFLHVRMSWGIFKGKRNFQSEEFQNSSKAQPGLRKALVKAFGGHYRCFCNLWPLPLWTHWLFLWKPEKTWFLSSRQRSLSFPLRLSLWGWQKQGHFLLESRWALDQSCCWPLVDLVSPTPAPSSGLRDLSGIHPFLPVYCFLAAVSLCASLLEQHSSVSPVLFASLASALFTSKHKS